MLTQVCLMQQKGDRFSAVEQSCLTRSTRLAVSHWGCRTIDLNPPTQPRHPSLNTGDGRAHMQEKMVNAWCLLFDVSIVWTWRFSYSYMHAIWTLWSTHNNALYLFVTVLIKPNYLVNMYSQPIFATMCIWFVCDIRRDVF